MPWYWILIILSAIVGPFEAMHALNKARRRREEAQKKTGGKERMTRAEVLKEIYGLEKHIEGGSFSEVYTAPFSDGGRPYAGSIYFLLDRGEVSRFHEIDCDEIWYYHEGCGMKITVLTGNGREELLLGKDMGSGERAMAVIPKGSIFAAENLEADGYTFVSCVTTPQFEYAGFRIVGKDEIRERFPELYGEIGHLA